MDDMNAELRVVVEAARGTRLTRADKARMWQRLEMSVGSGAEEGEASEPKRSMFPVMARRMFAVACVVALVLAVQGWEAATPTASGTAVASAVGGQPTPTPTTASPTTVAGTGHPIEAPIAAIGPAPQGTPNAVAPGVVGRVRSSSGVKRRVASREGADVVDASSAEPPTVAVRPAPARTRLLSSASSRIPTADSVAELVLGPRVPEGFREKLAAENLARYRAALAQHARIASLRRPLPSVGGYAAW